MPAARVERGSHRQAHEVIAPLARCALMPLPQSPLLKEGLIPQVEPSGGHFLLLERALGIGLAPIGEQRPVQLSREHRRAHEQLEGGWVASSSSPHLRQLIGQADPTALFHDHGCKALEQRGGSCLCLQTYLGQPLQEPLQKGHRSGGKPLAETTGRDLHFTSPGHLRQAVQGDLGLSEPAKDERLGSRPRSFARVLVG